MQFLLPVGSPVRIDSIYRSPATVGYRNILVNTSGHAMGILEVWANYSNTNFVLPTGRGDLFMMDNANVQVYELLDTRLAINNPSQYPEQLRLVWRAPLGLCLKLDPMRAIATIYPNADISTTLDTLIQYCDLKIR